MSDQNEQFGAGLPFFDALKLLSQYGPLLAKLQAIATAATPYDRAVAIVDALKWAAAQTSTTHLDDEAVEHLQVLLASPEGKAVFAWVEKLLTGGKA